VKISAIETLLLGGFPNMCWVRVETDAGISGWGETKNGARAVSDHIHDGLAPTLLGDDPMAIDRISRFMLYPYCGYKSTGAEIRAASAVDLALWDIRGKALNVPVYELLGGKTRERVRTYNTCAGHGYVSKGAYSPVKSWSDSAPVDGRDFEDLDAFLHRADELAESLLEMGFSGMKIWPFDQFAGESGGAYISAADLTKALVPFEKIRKRVGDKIDIQVEMHSMWRLPAAITIAKALEPYNPIWIEDPISMANLDAVAEFKRHTDIWVAASETLSTRWGFRDALEKNATSLAIFDIIWSGGLTEGKKIATLAETYEIPVAPHNCGGPLTMAASVHMSLNATNTLVQEMVRAFYFGWHQEVAENLPRFENGYLYAPDGPGLGTRLKANILDRPDAVRRRTAL